MLFAAPLTRFSYRALRGVPLTPPYGHGGGVASLEMAIEFHRTRGMPEGGGEGRGLVLPGAAIWLGPITRRKSAIGVVPGTKVG